VVGGLDWSNSLVCLNPKCSFLWLSFYTVYQKHFFNDVTEHKQYFCISSANSGPPGKWPLNGQRMCVCVRAYMYTVACNACMIVVTAYLLSLLKHMQINDIIFLEHYSRVPDVK